jgi:tetratricopeptide (TPR) repeat protein
MADPVKNNSCLIDFWVAMALLISGLALYYPSLQSRTFYFDDRFSIEHNEVIRTISLPGIFDAFNTRFLPGLSFAFNYQVSAQDPAGYRLVNLLIHGLNAFLVYVLVKLTASIISPQGPAFSSRRQWPAFFASMLFLCHPVQTETVNFITQRFVLMATFFYLLTLVFYIKYKIEFKKIYLVTSILAAAAAMFCKEFVVTLPVMLVLYEFFFLRASQESMTSRCRRLLPFFVIVLIVPVLLLRTPSGAVPAAKIADPSDITRAHKSIDRKAYFLTELNVIRTYVRLLVLPIDQNLDYDYPITHKVDQRTLISAGFLLCLLAVAWMTYRSYRIISFGILWFFVALSVESSIIPIGQVITEYRLYLASIGFVLLVTHLIYAGKADTKKLNMIAALLIMAFSMLTFQRNRVWGDELSLWNDVVQKSPHKARGYNYRGLAFYSKGDLAHALSDFNTALEIDPKDMGPYNNRANIYIRQGKFAQAIADITTAIEIEPSLAVLYNNRAIIYYQLGQYEKSQEDVRRAQALGFDVYHPLVKALNQVFGKG